MEIAAKLQNSHDAQPLTLDKKLESVSKEGDPTVVLGQIVGLIKNHCRSDVCSVYLIQPDRVYLVLAATVRRAAVRLDRPHEERH